MIMQKVVLLTRIYSTLTCLLKVPGVPAGKHWDTLPMDVKERVVSQVAQYIKAMFALRFERGGSLYLASPSGNEAHVGPIVSTPFYRAIDGVIRVPDAVHELGAHLSQYRGPFSNISDYLRSFLRAELDVVTHYRPIVLSEIKSEFKRADAQEAEVLLETGGRVLRKALELCSVYPGNHAPGGLTTSTPKRLFSLRLDDFRLSNIMVCMFLGRLVCSDYIYMYARSTPSPVR